MLPLVAKVEGRALAVGAFAGAALLAAPLCAGMLDVREVAQQGTVRAPWVSTCGERLEEARARLAGDVPELARGKVQQTWSLRLAAVELTLPPQYSARIEFRPGDDSPSVFDWEEAPTPVTGSFALHRRVGHFDLTVVADDSDGRGLAFAAKMQPLLDDCVMEAQ